MPKKSITTKSRATTKAKPIERKSKTLKGGKQKPIEKPPKKSVGPSPFEKAMAVFEQHFIGAEQKTGFELYQFFREALLKTLDGKRTEKALALGIKSLPKNYFSGLSLLEQEYLDNLLICWTIRETAPEMYSTLVLIIDGYIKPTKPRSGKELLKETASGLFVYFLSGRKGASTRQLEHLVSQILGVGLTYVETSYLRIKKNKPTKEALHPENFMSLLFLYWVLSTLGKSFDSPSAIKIKSKRSEKEFDKAKLAYNTLTQSIIDEHLPILSIFAKKHTKGSFSKACREMICNFEKNGSSPKFAFYTLFGIFAIKHLPQMATAPD